MARKKKKCGGSIWMPNLGWLSFLLPEQITINFFGLLTEKCICRKPRLCILMYVGSVIIVAVLSAFLGNWEMASVFDAYLPSVAKERESRSQDISESWYAFKEATGQIIPYTGPAWPNTDDLMAFVYDLRIDTDSQRIALMRAIDFLCRFVLHYKSSNGFSYEELDKKARNSSDTHWIRYTQPSFCDLMATFMQAEKLTRQASKFPGVPNPSSSPGGVSPSIMKVVNDYFDTALNDYAYGGWKNKYAAPPAGYLGGLNELKWNVPEFENWTTWQLEAVKALTEKREAIARAFKECNFHVVFNSEEYQSKEEGRVITVEAPKLVISLLLTITMSVFVCAHFKSKRYSRVLLALTSIGMSLFAIIAGISTGLLLGLELVPLVLMVAYLILGTGLDSGFLLMHEWCLTASKIDFEDSTATEFTVITARGAMLSVSLADWTAIAAFACGCFTPFQAVNLCCSYLALSISWLWLGEVFFFLPILCLQTRKLYPKERQKPNKDDNLNQPGPGPLNKLSENPKPPDEVGLNNYTNYRQDLTHEDHITERGSESKSKWGYITQDHVSSDYYYDESSAPGDPTESKKSEKKKAKAVSVFNCYERTIMTIYVNATSVHPFRYMWMLSFLLMSTIFTAALVSMMTYEDVTMYYLDDSFSKLYLDRVQTYGPEANFTRTLMMIRNPIASTGRQITTDPDFIDAIDRLNKTIVESPSFKDPKFLGCFLRYVRSPRVAGGEYNLTTECRSGTDYAMGQLPNKDWRINQVRFKCDRRSSKLMDVRDERKVLDEMEALEAAFGPDSAYDLELEMSDMMYGLMWRDCALKGALWMSVLQALICCLVMVTLFIPEPLVIIVTVCMTCITMSTIFGCWWFVIRLTYNSVNFIVSLIATGMCIDYTAHGGHAFFAAWREHTEKKEEERKERREQRRRRREEEGEYGPDDEGDEDDLRKQKSMADEVLRETLALISVPLLNSALSSAIGMFIILVTSACQAFRDMAIATLSVFSLSLINGSIMLPICMSYIVLTMECVREIGRQRRVRKREIEREKRMN